MKILITGASGFIGSNLTDYLSSQGFIVKKAVRRNTEEDNEIYWNIDKNEFELEDFEGFDVFINLSGENVFGYWTKEKKSKIVNSRLNSTKLLTKIISKLNSPPKTFISSSAIGYYGNRGDEVLDEYSQKGTGFFADLADEWENSSKQAIEKNLRVINLRIGLVLSGKGGALKKMLTPFKLGLGGNISDGNMYLSWISIDDLLSSVLYIINTKSIKGAVNIVSTKPVKNKEFTKVLGRVLSRPTLIPIPAILIKTFLGEFGKEALLASTRVIPKKLSDSGFTFLHTDLKSTLEELINNDK